MIAPTAKQLVIRDALNLDLLVIAPAGCGKTEALALRVKGLLERGALPAPRRVLVITFSNRARDNIRERLRSYLSPAELRDRVTISNFHGLSARIFRAHANVIRLDSEMLLPDGDWVGDECRRRKLDFPSAAAVQSVLGETKREARDDDEVEAELARRGNKVAQEIERLRRAEGRLTYDDLPRVAELILANDKVAQLYATHFAAIVVDEFQDLTPQQLRIVNRVGLGRTTYAGDLAQGIYGFAGARPDEIDKAIRAECGVVVEFSESHRSSPAVLNVVNSLATLTLGQILTCADPSLWPSSGLAGLVGHNTADAEAAWLVKVAEAISVRVPLQRTGVIARTVGRRRFADAAFAASGLPVFRWDDGVLDTDTAKLVKRMLGGFSLTSFHAAADKIEYLQQAAQLDAVTDVDVRRNLVDALIWVHDLLEISVTPEEIRGRVRVGDTSTLLTSPGVHLLTGHVGKGQQFDWVFVLGNEEGVLPDFRATSEEDIAEEARVLSVMASRARHGVILTHAANVTTNAGNPMQRDRSRFLKQIADSSPRDAAGIVEWFRSADWEAIANR